MYRATTHRRSLLETAVLKCSLAIAVVVRVVIAVLVLLLQLVLVAMHAKCTLLHQVTATGLFSSTYTYLHQLSTLPKCSSVLS
jgi:hypothetical protein